MYTVEVVVRDAMGRAVRRIGVGEPKSDYMDADDLAVWVSEQSGKPVTEIAFEFNDAPDGDGKIVHCPACDEGSGEHVCTDVAGFGVALCV